MRRYVACRFRPGDRKSFTYHWDGKQTLKPGDQVKVPHKSGDGWSRVTVVSVTAIRPAFDTKAIMGKLEPEPPAQGDLLTPSDVDEDVQSLMDRDRY